MVRLEPFVRVLLQVSETKPHLISLAGWLAAAITDLGACVWK